MERSLLARLATEEQHMHRRLVHVQNFGSGWLRPPGLPKTLHQMREERREQEEHQEALRREQLAQELAEAEAGGAAPEDGLMDDVQLDGAQDLDDEIPDADDHFGLQSDSESGGDEEEEGAAEADDSEVRANDLMAARMRMTDDAFREALVRGDPDGDDMYDGEEELEEEHQGHMLDEDDFADDGNLGMEANLDDDIPEAESGLYEHTDSDAELSSSEEEDDGGEGFAPRAPPPDSPTTRGRPSMDISGILSQDESSFMDSSPVERRRRGR